MINRLACGLTGCLLTALFTVNAHAATTLLRQNRDILTIDDTASGVVSVVLNSNPYNNIKVGQKIRISGTVNYNGVFTIIGVTDQTHFTYEDTAKTNSTALEDFTGGPYAVAGGHYSDITLWEAQDRNLTAAGENDVEVLECYNDWAGGYSLGVTLEISGWITDAPHNVTITVPPTERHKGYAGSGFRIVGGNFDGNLINIFGSYVTVEYLELYSSGDVTGDYDFAISVGENAGIGNDVTGIVVRNCIIHDMGSVGFGLNGAGIVFGMSQAADRAYVYNNVIYNMTLRCIGSNPGHNRGTAYVYNNTVYNWDMLRTGVSGGLAEEGCPGEWIVYNNIAITGGAGAGPAFEGTFTGDYNIASDTTAPGGHSLQSRTLASMAFNNSSAGDFRLTSTSVARNAGVPGLGGTDLVGSLRRQDDGWDIGAHEYIGTPATTVPQSVRLIRASNQIGAIARTSNMVRVTLAEDNFPNYEVGQSVRISGVGDHPSFNGVFTIVDISDDDSDGFVNSFQFSQYAPDETGSGLTAASVAGGHYSALSAWETGEQRDLTASADKAVAECYNDWPNGMPMNTAADALYIYGWSTDADNTLTVYTPAGERHDGTLGTPGDYTGFTIVNSVDIGACLIELHQQNYVFIDGLSIATSAGMNGVYVTYFSNNNQIKNCIYAGAGSSGNGYHNYYGGGNTYFINCLAYDCGIGFYSGDNDDGVFVNCTAVDCATAGFYRFYDNGGAIRAYNCLAYVSNPATQHGFMLNGTADGVFVGCRSNDTDDVLDSPGGSGSATNCSNDVSVTFRDANNNDFRLAYNDTGAADAGRQTAYMDTTYDRRLMSAKYGIDVGFDQYKPGAEVPESVSLIRADRDIDSIQRLNNQVTLIYSGIDFNVGQLVRIRDCSDRSLNGVYRIDVSATDETDTLVFSSYGPDSALIGDAEAGTVGGHYSSLSEWERDLGGTSGVLTWDNVRATASCYDDWSTGLDDDLTVDGRWTTDAARFITITAPPSERHDGRAPAISGRGFYLRNSPLVAYPAYSVIEYLASTGNGINIRNRADQGVIRNCLVWNNVGDAAFAASQDASQYVYNNIAYNIDLAGIYLGSGPNHFVFNNTLYHTGETNATYRGIYGGNTASTYVYNNISIDHGVAASGCFASAYVVGNSGNNISSDATAPGAGSIQYADVATALAAVDFVSTAPGSEDLRLQSTSSAAGAGIGAGIGGIDTAGLRRPRVGDTNVDIGAHEYAVNDSPREVVRYIRATRLIAGLSRNNNTVTATFASNAAYNNYEAGQIVVVQGVTTADHLAGPMFNGTFVVTSANATQVQFTCAGPDVVLFTPASATVGGHYDKLSSWEADFGGTSGDLVGENIKMTAVCYDDWVNGLDDAVTIKGWNTDSTHFVTVTVAPADRHNGTAHSVSGSGFYIDPVTEVATERAVIAVEAPHSVIEYMDIQGWGDQGYSRGVHVKGAGDYSTVRSCIIHENDTGAANGNVGISIDGENGNDASYIKLYNNVIYAVTGYGISARYYCAGAEIYNNTIYGCDVFGIRMSTYLSVWNNISVDNGENYNNENVQSSGYNITSTDPALTTNFTGDIWNYSASDLFEDAAAGDFRLKTGSPAINAGVGTPYSSDVTGGERSDGFRDVGAFEADGTNEAIALIRSNRTISSVARASTGLATITLSAAHTNIKPGQKIRISGLSDNSFNGVYTIHTVPTTTTFSYYNPGPVVNTTVMSGTAGGHYAKLSSWNAAYGGVDYAGLGTTPGNLVAAERIAVAECYNDWPAGLPDHLNMQNTPWNSNASYYPKIYVPLSERHNGTAKSGGNYTGFAMINDSSDGLFWYTRAYFHIEGMIGDNNGQGETTFSCYYGNCIVKDCIALNAGAGAQSSGFWAGTVAGNNTFINCIAYNVVAGFYGNTYSGNKYINCTAYNCTTGFSTNANSAGAVSAVNCLAAGCTTGFAAPNLTAAMTLNYCASDDGTADDFGGTGNRVDQTFSFVNTSADAEDFHLASNDTGARGYGVQTSYAFEDIDGDLRSADNVWDIGADQYTVTGTVTDKISLIRAGQAISSIQRASNTVTVQLSAAYPNNNLKVGQKIRISGVSDESFNGVYTIASCDTTSYDDFTFVQYGPSAGPITTGIMTAGGHYDRLSTWEQQFGGTSGYLTSDSRTVTAECFNDWSGGLDNKLTINGWATDATRFVKVTAPPMERHTGVAQTGFYIRTTANADDLIIYTPYTTVEYIDITSSGGGGYTINATSPAAYSIIRNCIVRSGGKTGVRLEASTAWCYNNVVHDCGIDGIIGSGALAYNNTVYRCAHKGISGTRAWNNISVNNGDQTGDDDDYVNVDSNDGYNISSDGTADDNGAVSGRTGATAAALFAAPSVTPPDLRLLSGTVARDTAKDAGFESDVDGHRRTVPDIGADEYSADSVPEKVCLIRADADISSIRRVSNTVTVTLSGDYPNGNLKAGQKIKISGVASDYSLNGVYTIATANTAGAQDIFTYTCAGTDNGTDITDSGMTAGGHYTSLSAWEQDFGGTTGNLVRENIRVTAECYDDWSAGLDDTLTIKGWNTDSTHYVTVTVASTDRHNGTPGGGFFIDPVASSSSAVNAWQAYTILEYFELTGFSLEGVRINDVQYVTVRNCIIHNGDAGSQGVYLNNCENVSVYNNIVYDIGAHGIYANTVTNGRIFNNTVYSCGNGIFDFLQAGAVWNNISIGNTTVDYQTLSANDGYNISSDNTAASGGIGGITGVTAAATFATPGSNFHLLSTASAVNAGFQTAWATDVDGQTRTGAFDIGADEYNAASTEVVKLIRAGAANNILNITRAAGVVTVNLDSAYPNNNLKAGQSIVIKDVPTASFNGTYTIASIATATNQTQFTYNQAGPDETDNSGTGTAGGHYSTLSAWEVDFGGIEYAALGAARGDLVTAQKIAVAECYNDWAGGLGNYNIGISGWTSNSTYYLKILTPLSERHDGRLKDESGNYTGFTLYLPASYMQQIVVYGGYVVLDGIAMDARVNSTNSSGVYAPNDSTATVSIMNCIAAGYGNSESYGAFRLLNSQSHIMVNNIAYDCYRGFLLGGWHGNALIYNCTAINCRYGFVRYGGAAGAVAQFVNCLAWHDSTLYSTYTDYAITLSNGEVTYSAASDDTIPAGIGNRASQTFRFMDEDNNDFRLAHNDTGAKDHGTNLSANPDYPFSDDIDGNARTSWDIGADETSTEFICTIRAAGGDYTTLSAWESVVDENLVDGSAKVFSGTLTGSIADGAALTLSAGGITGVACHVNGTGQIMVRAISDPDYAFAAGQQWRVDVSNYFTISDAGNGAIPVAECYNDWVGGLSNNVTLLGFTTDAQHYPVIRAAAGHAHTGAAGTGFRLQPPAGAAGILIQNVDYARIENIEIDKSQTTFACIRLNGSSTLIPVKGHQISGCLMYGNNGTTGGFFNMNYRAGGLKLFNNIFYGMPGDGIGTIANDSTGYYFNNTVYGCTGTYGIVGQAGIIAINNISIGNNDNWNGTFNAASDYNITSGTDAQMPGAHSLSNVTSTIFRSTTGGSEDLRLATGAAAIGQGLDLSQYANNPYIKELRNAPNDINRDTRNASWCIGADEYELPVISGMTASQSAVDGTVTITYTGTMQENDAAVSYVATSCEHSRDNVTWGDMTRIDAGTENFTTAGAAGLSFVWNAETDLTVEDTVWVRLQVVDPNDNESEITTVASSFVIDTRAPLGLAAFRISNITATHVTLSWTAATDTNFHHYEIWYATSLNDVNNRAGSAVEWDSTDDAALASAATTTTAIPLDLNATYYFRIWAFDDLAEAGVAAHESSLPAVHAGSDASLDVTPCDAAAAGYMVNHTGNAVFAWTLLQALPADGFIEITLPAGYDVSGVTTAASATIDGTLTTAVNGQTVTVTRSGGTQTAAGTAVSITLDDVRNPNAFGTAGLSRLSTRTAAGTYLEQAFDLTGDTMVGFIFTSPTNLTNWGVGDVQTVSWSVSGLAGDVTLEYLNNAGIWEIANSSTAQGISGTSVSWTIPNLSLGNDKRVRVRLDSAVAPPDGLDWQATYDEEFNVSPAFAIGGGLDLTAPDGGEVWSVDSAHNILYSTFGTYADGVIIEYSLDSGSTWSSIAGSDDNGIDADSTPAAVQLTPSDWSFSWTPGLTAGIPQTGDAEVRVRVRNADTSAPASTDTSAADFTIAGVTVSYTPPDRANSAVQVGATGQIVSWTQTGTTHVGLRYSTDNGTSWKDMTGAADVDAVYNTHVAAGAGSYSWTVSDDAANGTVLIRAAGCGADGSTAEASSGIEGVTYDDLDTAFTIYGQITREEPGSVADVSYSVNNSNDRVPISWLYSQSIPGFTFQYMTNFATQNWQDIPMSQIYDTATGLVNDSNSDTRNYNMAVATVGGQYRGTAWWQPPSTGNVFYIRIRDVNDTATFSATAVGNRFRVSGLAISGVAPASPFEVSGSVTISGTGAGTQGDQVRVLWAPTLTDAQNRTNCTQIGGFATVSVGAWSQNWTVPDAISETIYLRAEDPGNSSIYNLGGPYSIVGILTVADPGGPWIVGAAETVTGTVTGAVSTVRLEYTTDDGATYTTLNDGGGTPITALAVSGGAFTATVTVPDAIGDTFRIRAVDSTAARAPGVCAGSALTVAISVRGALTIETPADDFIVNRPETIVWTATGSMGNATLQYRSAADSGSLGAAVWQDIDTVASGGSGTTAINGNHTWDNVPDAVDAHLDVTETGIQNSSDAGGSDVAMQLRIVDADNGAVYAESAAFVCRYVRIALRVQDPMGNALSNMNISESATVTPVKAQWVVSDNSFDGTNDIAVGDYRFYPYNGGAGDNAYSTRASHTDGGTLYQATVTWRADTDKQQTITVDTSATASVSFSVAVDVNYDGENDAININSWVTRKGLVIDGIGNPASSDYDAGAAISVNVYDAAGTLLNADDLGDGISPNTVGVFSGISYDPAAGLRPGTTYIVKVVVTYNSVTYTGTEIFVIPNVFTYAVRATAVYNSTNDSAIINAWLERSGTTILRPGDLTLVLRDSSGTEMFSAPYDGYDDVDDLTADSNLRSNGVYTQIEWDPAAGITAGEVYTVEATIAYQTRSYRTYASFSKSGADIIAADVAQIASDLGTVSTNVIAATAAATAAQSAAQSAQASVSSIESSTGEVLTAVTVASEAVTGVGTAVQNIDDNVQSVSGTISAVYSEVGALDDVSEATDSMSVRIAGIDTAIERINSTLTRDTATRNRELERLYAQLVALSDDIRSTAGGEIDLSGMLEILEGRKGDFDYLKNKTQELKAAVDMSAQMMDNVTNEPVVTTWYEFR